MFLAPFKFVYSHDYFKFKKKRNGNDFEIEKANYL